RILPFRVVEANLFAFGLGGSIASHPSYRGSPQLRLFWITPPVRDVFPVNHWNAEHLAAGIVDCVMPNFSSVFNGKTSPVQEVEVPALLADLNLLHFFRKWSVQRFPFELNKTPDIKPDGD